MASSSDEKLRAFLLARDRFFGDNYESANCEAALLELATMDHEEAVWLSGLFRGRTLPDRSAVRSVFLEHPEDKRAMFMTGMLGLILSEGTDAENWARIWQSAELGYGYALGWQAWKSDGPEKVAVARRAALEGDREGMFTLGNLLLEDPATRAEGLGLIRRCAELGYVRAMHRFAHVGFEGRPWAPEALVWRARAAAKNYSVDQFLHDLRQCCDSLTRVSERRDVVFHLGRELRLDTTLNQRWSSESKYVRLAVEFYNRICQETRAAVEAWLIVSRRMGLYKDLRRVIACMVWQTREECLEIQSEKEPVTKRTRRNGLEELQTGDSEAVEEEKEEVPKKLKREKKIRKRKK